VNYYAGIHAFRGYARRVFKLQGAPYDWADLSPDERKKFAQREMTPRERRKAKRKDARCS
jgi:hypothetical protein